ncbi:hypothetical protein [Pseudomonas brassicacearum]|uniref:hypothetical protein n=1 Tax=Pseudomonas brassicacearum TaxID=930166 RepID=UPI00218245C4|nr:hypothetical protein [Pseudomonas brassicacearum]
MLQFEGFVQQNFGFAATTFRMVVEALRGDAVEAVAVGAGDEEWVGYADDPVKKPVISMWRRLLTFSIVQKDTAYLG